MDREVAARQAVAVPGGEAEHKAGCRIGLGPVSLLQLVAYP